MKKVFYGERTPLKFLLGELGNQTDWLAKFNGDSDFKCIALKVSRAKLDKNTSLPILYTCSIYFNTCLQNTIYLLKL